MNLDNMKSNNFDIIYMNSLFSINFTLIPLLSSISMNIKSLAPRGMLGKRALEIKPLRKKYFKIFQIFLNQIYFGMQQQSRKNWNIK